MEVQKVFLDEGKGMTDMQGTSLSLTGVSPKMTVIQSEKNNNAFKKKDQASKLDKKGIRLILKNNNVAQPTADKIILDMEKVNLIKDIKQNITGEQDEKYIASYGIDATVGMPTIELPKWVIYSAAGLALLVIGIGVYRLVK